MLLSHPQEKATNGLDFSGLGAVQAAIRQAKAHRPDRDPQRQVRLAAQ